MERCEYDRLIECDYENCSNTSCYTYIRKEKEQTKKAGDTFAEFDTETDI